MALFVLWVVAYFLVLAAAVFWFGTALKVSKARRADVRLVHLVLGVLLVGVATALILRAPLLAIVLSGLVALGMRASRAREALARWWDEVREAQAQRRWSLKCERAARPRVRGVTGFAAVAATSIWAVTVVSG
jgi:hypothetical protein